MARHDVYRSPKGDYLLDVQSPLLEALGTQVVVPLLPAAAAPRLIARLHPVFEIEGVDYVMATHLLSAVPATLLSTRIGNLSHRRDEIIAALDMLFQGFRSLVEGATATPRFSPAAGGR